MYEEKNTDGIFFIRRVAIFFGTIAAVVAVALIIILVVPEPEQPETREQRAARIDAERQAFSESLTREQLLYDFDYFMYVLEHNFPFFGVAYRRHGADIIALGAELRIRLEEETDHITATDFNRMLWTYIFTPVNRLGHLHSIGRAVYINILSNSIEFDSPINVYVREMIERNPNIRQFYGDVDYYDIEAAFNAVWRNPGNITTEIVEEGRIAYMHIQRMVAQVQPCDIVAVRSLYTRIADFEHLIIDIRGNGGGNWWYPHDIVTIPHFNSFRNFGLRMTTRYVVFYKGGEHNLNFLETLYSSRRIPRTLRPSHFSNSGFVVENNTVTGRHNMQRIQNSEQMVWEDLEALDYYHMSEFIVRQWQPQFQSNFTGQMWLLIDGGVASASAQFANFYRYNDLAILVGEVAGGSFGSPGMESKFFSLPNTGIIVRYDIGMAVCRRTGRILEEGVLPHYFNRPGMDALETTLALIEEGWYR